MEGILGFILGIICVVLCGILFHRAHDRVQMEVDSHQNDSLWREERRLQEELAYIHRQISEMNESIMKMKEQIASIEYGRSVGKEPVRPFSNSSYETQSQSDAETDRRKYKLHKSPASIRGRDLEEATDLVIREKEIISCMNQNIGAIADQLRRNGYLIERRIEISNGADVINNMELPIMKENPGGIIGLISSGRKTGEYFAVPTTRRIPKSLLVGGAFRYLFDWKNAEGIVEISQPVAIMRVEKLPLVVYSQEQKGYQMVQGSKGCVMVEN